MKIEKLEEMAKKGDHLAAYYLGQHYFEIQDNNEAIYWLLRANEGEVKYGCVLLGRLLHDHPEQVWKVRKKMKMESV